MRRHLPAAAAGIALGEIFETELTRRHAAAQNQTAIAIIWNDIIIGLHLDRDRRQRFVPHSGNMKMSFALAVQILLAQICMPAFKNDRQQSQLIFLA